MKLNLEGKIGLFIIIVYSLLQIPLYLSPVMVPDEAHFLDMAKHNIETGGLYDQGFI